MENIENFSVDITVRAKTLRKLADLILGSFEKTMSASCDVTSRLVDLGLDVEGNNLINMILWHNDDKTYNDVVFAEYPKEIVNLNIECLLQYYFHHIDFYTINIDNDGILILKLYEK